MKRHIGISWALSVMCALPCIGQTSGSCGSGPGTLTSAETLPSGIMIHAGNTVEQITALRDDVLRIRMGHDGTLPEDASWAVLAKARESHATVQRDDTENNVGFRTPKLQVSIRRRDLLMTVRDAQGNIVEQQAKPVCFDQHAFRFTNQMPEDEHYFGLGDKTGAFDRRGQAFTLWNTDSYRFQQASDPLYKSIPFFLTFRAGVSTGVLLDNTWRSTFDFGRTTDNVYSFGAEDGPIDLYLFLGPSPRQVVETYAWLTGTPPLPPRWSLGFQQSRYSYAPEKKLVNVAEHLRADHIPADALYLDIDFQDRNRPFTVDKNAFPDMASTVSKLKAMHFHTVAITDLHIANAPNQGYAPFDTGSAGDHFVHNPNGSVFTGVVWPGPSVFPDFTQQSSREWWGTLYKPFVTDGFEGFWNDMNEPSVFNTPNKTMPLDTVHRIDEPGFATRSASHSEIHNVYGMENSRGTYDGLRRLDPDKRPFVLTRATYAGGQRYAVTWTGDDSSTWDHLRLATFMLKNLGLSGFGFAGADIGGFAGSPPMDLLTRWLEIGAFQPIDRDHSEKGSRDQEPWVGGPEQEAIRRRYIEERYRLMPYLYTGAEENSRTGVPMMRPLFLDYPDAASDKHPLDVDGSTGGEFLLGHDLLIAPSPYPEEPDAYTVEFPTALWYDYWTGKPVPATVAPPQSINFVKNDMPVSPSIPLTAIVHPTLETLPVYVRGGAIVPIAPLTQSTDEVPNGPLTLRVYEGPNCRGSLYHDDGETFAFQRGQFLRMTFSCSSQADGLHVTVSPHEGTYPAWWKAIHIEVFRANRKIEAEMQDDGKGRTVVVQ